MPSYEQSKDSKLWSVRFRENVDGKSVNKRLSGFRTRYEAELGYKEYINNVYGKSLTFDSLVVSYLQYQKGRIKESSLYDISRKTRNHILPYFSERIVSSIKPIDILEWQSTLNEYSYKYRQSLRGQLSSLLRFAERYYDVPNVMYKVDKLRDSDEQDKIQYWTADEFNSFIKQIPLGRPEYRLFFITLYILGCRKGEALALTWNDLNLETGVISITKSITRKVEGKPYAVTTPKNKTSNRKILITKNFCNEFQKYRQTLGDIATDTAFVFGVTRPLPERTIDRIFLQACIDAGVKKIRIHDLRHSCASLLISRGVPITAISKRLGHKNIEQTLNTYSHMMPEDEVMMQGIMNELIAIFCSD